MLQTLFGLSLPGSTILYHFLETDYWTILLETDSLDACGRISGSLTLPDCTMNLEPFELERFFAVWEFEASHLLCCSDCEPLTVQSLLEHADAESLESWNKLTLGYTMSNGWDVLRREIAAMYETVKEDEINVVVPEEGIYLSMLAMLKEGDHVVVTYPGYQSLYEIARSLGCHLHYWKPKADDEGCLNFSTDDLKEMLDGNPIKLVVMNFPHNPTGKSCLLSI